MERLRVGVVGVGVGRAHLKAYQSQAKDVDIVALCDLNETRLHEVGDEFEVPLRYTDYDTLFASGAIEAVSICLPNSLHAPVSIAALNAGLHVLCEKPLANDPTSGQEIVDAAAGASGKFMVCFNRRYRPDVQWMKQAIKTKQLGRIYRVKAGWVRETGIPGWTGWFTNKAVAGGGPLIDLGVHMLDSVLWLLDYPEPLTVSGDVQANFGRHGLKTWHKSDNQSQHSFTVEDSATAFIRLAEGVSLNLETSWASHGKPGMDDFFITLMGTQGTIELYVANYATKNTLTFYTEINGSPVTTKPRIDWVESDHNYAIVEFIRTIQQDIAPTASAEQGLTITKIIDAIYQSAEVGREVKMT